MPLEIFTDSDSRERINITKLSLDAPESKSGLHFDAKRDITEEDWKGIRSLLARATGTESIRKYQNLAMLPFIDLSRAKMLVSREDVERMSSRLEEYRENEQWLMFLRFAKRLDALEERVTITEEEWGKILKDLKRQFLDGSGRYSEARDMAASIATIDRTKLPQLTLEEWKNIDNQLSLDDFNYEYVESQIVQIKPERVLEYSEKSWQQLLAYLEQFRKVKDWNNFITSAYALAVFSDAERKFVKPELAEPAPPLPEVRNF